MDSQAARSSAASVRTTPGRGWPRLASSAGCCAPGDTVLTTVLDVALQLGANPIIFAGADMAFTQDRPYARGTSYEEEWRQREAWGEAVEHAWATSVQAWPLVEEYGVDGRLVRTAPHLREFRDWIVEQTRKHPDRRFVNATEAGILLGGTIEQSSLADAVRSLASGDAGFAQRIREAYRPDPDAPARSQAEAARLVSSFNANGAPVDDWLTFACRTDIQDDIKHALTTEARPRRHLYVVRTVAAPVEEATSSEAPEAAPPPPNHALLGERLNVSDRLIETLSEADRIALAELVDSLEPRAVISVVTLGERHQVNLDRARRAAERLTKADALVLVDEIGTAAGAELHRVAFQLLHDDERLWLADRRFGDHTSRLVIVSADPSTRSSDPSKADAAKWSADHRPVARRLAPLVWAAFKPSSVHDIGCGAGYWLEALKDLGQGR